MISCFHDNPIHATWIARNPFSLIEKDAGFALNRRMKTLGDKIKARIEEMGLSQKDAAQAIGISQQRLGNYAQDTRKPNVIILIKIARALGVSTDWLLGVSDCGPVADIQPVVSRLLELDGMNAEKAQLLGEVSQEAVRLLSSLSGQANYPETAHLAAQAVWNSRLFPKPS